MSLHTRRGALSELPTRRSCVAGLARPHIIPRAPVRSVGSPHALSVAGVLPIRCGPHLGNSALLRTCSRRPSRHCPAIHPAAQARRKLCKQWCPRYVNIRISCSHASLRRHPLIRRLLTVGAGPRPTTAPLYSLSQALSPRWPSMCTRNVFVC